MSYAPLVTQAASQPRMQSESLTGLIVNDVCARKLREGVVMCFGRLAQCVIHQTHYVLGRILGCGDGSMRVARPIVLSETTRMELQRLAR